MINSTKVVLYFLLIFGLSRCADSSERHLKEGIWRGEIEISGNKIMPFLFEVDYKGEDTLLFLLNASERIEIDDFSVSGDSVKIPMHIFDAALVAKVEDDSLNGDYIKYYEEDYKLPFRAEYGIIERFKGEKQVPDQFTGEWAVTFYEPGDTVFAVGDFRATTTTNITGTFRLATGDFRYLEGVVINDTMKLSTFDGNHAYLFNAVAVDDSTLHGDFWSGKGYHASWTARKDSNATLPSHDSLTYLKAGFDRIDFSFPDLDSNMVSPDDYLGKVLILQIFGSWCPNCMDETKFLAQWYSNNKEKPVEILGLAYEVKDDFNYARSRIMRMKNKLGPEYKFLIAGTKDKEAVSKTLPMLNEVISFPTLIFIDKEGKVRKIHTGFSGPGTFEHYEKLKENFNKTVNQMLEEPE